MRLPYHQKSDVYELYVTFHNHYDTKTSTARPLHYTRALELWKHSEELQYIKLAKLKSGFSKCTTCSTLKDKLRKCKDNVDREYVEKEHEIHINITRKERKKYYAARLKAQKHPEKCMCIIVDAMDQKKTNLPYFVNPPSNVAGLTQVKTKIIGAIVHGFGPLLYWCTEDKQHGTALTIEVIRRTLIKYEQDKGRLPPRLYLQLDNASDNKSREMLAFCGYLVQLGVFNSIKLSYLVVGHTHEYIDQYFSCISCFFKRVVKTISL